MSESTIVPLASSSKGWVSGKSWKEKKKPIGRSHRVKTKNWEDRMQKMQKALSTKKLERGLIREKQAELKRRREVTAERKKAAEEKMRLEEAKTQMGARKAARLRRRAGRTKKMNH